MGLTPDDIVNYPLKQAVKGYKVEQVDDLLDQVADALERAQRDNVELRRKLEVSEQRLAAASETEATLKRTLVTAQRAAEQSLEEAKARAAEHVEDARREAQGLLEQARLDAEELRVEALRSARAEEAEIRRRRQELEGQIEALRSFEREYRSRLRSHLDEQRRLLDEVATRPADLPTDDPEDPSEGTLPAAQQELGVDAANPEDVVAEEDPPHLTVRVREDEQDPADGQVASGAPTEVRDH